MLRYNNTRLYRQLSNILSNHFHSSLHDLRICYLQQLINLRLQYHKNSRVYTKLTIQRIPIIHQQLRTLCTKTDKKDVILDEKVAKKELLHDVLKQNKERLLATEQAIRAKSEFIIKDIKETKHKMKEKMEEAIPIIRENIYTIPNLLCITRIVASPYLGYLIVQQDYHLAFALLVVAGITDLMDGWIARTWDGQSSKLGSFLDPMADKVLIATLFLTLTYSNLIPLLLTEMIIARDLLLVGAGFVIRFISLPKPRTLSRYFDASHVTAELAPTFISKVNTAVQLTLVATTLAAPVFGFVDHTALHVLWYTTGFTTLTSALSYVFSKNTYKVLRRN
ncbi:probable cardiolipin synthase (CMP-forming) [Chrysoperla carnea]|uniref:probable cardiolipin synthase (CMP-forming) n=1 Tax=Chrysoperla carnea TaxID=189513 RepID=UPI001D05F207|nr:probable cardiolipin synthase (CMP-forming) [Chrysoperla carnea]